MMHSNSVYTIDSRQYPVFSRLGRANSRLEGNDDANKRMPLALVHKSEWEQSGCLKSGPRAWLWLRKRGGAVSGPGGRRETRKSQSDS